MANSLKYRLKTRVNNAVARHAKAQIALSWSGSKDPDDRPLIEEEARRAEKCLANAINALLDAVDTSRAACQNLDPTE